MPDQGSMVILVDDDGDEFPLWRLGQSDEQILKRAEVFVTEGSWRPNGPLRVLEDRDV